MVAVMLVLVSVVSLRSLHQGSSWCHHPKRRVQSRGCWQRSSSFFLFFSSITSTSWAFPSITYTTSTSEPLRLMRRQQASTIREGCIKDTKPLIPRNGVRKLQLQEPAVETCYSEEKVATVFSRSRFCKRLCHCVEECLCTIFDTLLK